MDEIFRANKPPSAQETSAKTSAIEDDDDPFNPNSNDQVEEKPSVPVVSVSNPSVVASPPPLESPKPDKLTDLSQALKQQV